MVINILLCQNECHHEKFDGSGYYEKLKGDDIPLKARIISVADAYSGGLCKSCGWKVG